MSITSIGKRAGMWRRRSLIDYMSVGKLSKEKATLRQIKEDALLKKE